jgi:WD40 repeat protein/tetratricopeptide (TPR) repeat protein
VAREEQQAADRARAAAVKARDETETAQRETQQNLYYAEMSLAGQAAAAPGSIGRIHELLAHWYPAGSEPDRRGWEWYYLRGLGQQALRTLHRHTAWANRVSWSPDGKRLASAGNDGTIKLWDSQTGREIATLRGHTHPWLDEVRWSPDGHRLASACDDQTVKVWDVATRQEIATLRGHTNYLTDVDWSPDGHRLASTSYDQTVKIWDVDKKKEVLGLVGHTRPVETVRWNHDGRVVASAGDDLTIKLWDANTGKLIRTISGHTGTIRALAWSPEGRRLASASGDETVRIWDPETGREINVLRGHTSPVLDVAWSPDGRRLASSSYDQTVRLWEAETGRETALFQGHTEELESVAWSPDGQRLASAGCDQTIRIWDLSSPPPGGVFRGHAGFVSSVSWSPDGRRLVSGSSDSTLRLWDVATGREVATLRGHKNGVYCASWSPDGRLLASGGSDQTIKLWDPQTGREVTSIQAHGLAVRMLSWSPDSRRLASIGGDTTVKLWDVATGNEKALALKRTLPVWQQITMGAVRWSPEGRHIACAAGNETIYVWDAESGQQTAVLAAHANGSASAVAWSPDGRRLASGGVDHLVKLWDLALQREIAVLRGHTGAVWFLSWSPDGRRLASAGRDHTVRIWDTATGREIVTLRGHAAQVSCVSWSPDGHQLASASSDQTVRLWDAGPGYVVERSPSLLPELDRRLKARPDSASDLRLRAEIRARLGRWEQAAADWSELPRTRQGDKRRWFEACWWVVGPFGKDPTATPEPGTNPDPLQAVPLAGPSPPAPLTLGEGRRGEGALLHWRRTSTSDDGCLDLADLFPAPVSGCAYALLRVYSSREQPIAALLRASGSLRFWHNGRLVHQAPPHPADADDSALPLTLQSGWNTFLFQVGLGTPSDRLCLWLSTEPGDRARAHACMGQDAEAAACIAKAVEEGANEFLVRLLNLPPPGDSERYRKALEEARKALDKTPSPAPEFRHALAEKHYQLGDLLERAGKNHQAAIEAYSQAFELDPNHTELPEDPRLCLARARALVARGDHERATAACEKAIGLGAGNVAILVESSNVLGGSGRWDKAIAGYTKAIELDPKNALPLNNLAWLLATCPDAKLRDPAKAVELAKKAVGMAPKEGTLRNTLGTAHYRVGDWKAAVEALNKSMELRKGGDSFDWFFLAMAHWQLGEKEEARKWYDKAVAWMTKNQPKDQELIRFRAEAGELLGMKENKN